MIMLSSKSLWLRSTKKGLLVTILMAGIAWLLLGPIPLPSTIGRGDFIAYWSAAYLLAHSQNFSDPDLLLQTEQALAGWRADYVIKTWNPPWLLPILLPYTFVLFNRAVWLWLLTNIGLVFVASIMTWKACARQPHVQKWVWIAPATSILFAPALNAFYMGQINPLVFFGLALMLFVHVEHAALAGAALALTMVKPHLVYITVPILLLHKLVDRQWRFLLSFGGTLAALTSITYFLRPSFITEYVVSSSGGNLLGWATPTLGGILSMSLGWEWAKLMGVVILPLFILWWWRRGNKLRLPGLVQITLLASVVTAPFGWGYDVIVLLIPLLQVIIWNVAGHFSRYISWLFIVTLIVTNALIFYQRRNMENELQAFWVPIAIAAIYFVAYLLKQNDHAKSAIAI